MDPGSDQSPLPAKDFCNSWGKGNPVLGKGPLGNSNKKKMYYKGGDRERMVNKVQRMLSDLGYDVGSSGPDGKFGDDTEAAVKQFQDEHKDWDGNSLKVDGLVGPETSDALNRKMVEKGWYDHYQSDTALTQTFSLVTATSAALRNTVNTRVDGTGKVKLVIVDFNPDVPIAETLFRVRLHDSGCKPAPRAAFRVLTSDIDASGETDEDGWASIRLPTNRCFDQITIEWTPSSLGAQPLTKDLLVDCEGGDDVQRTVARLHNLGYSRDRFYYEAAVRAFQSDYDIWIEAGLTEDGSLPPTTKTKLEAIYDKNNCDATCPPEGIHQ